MLIRKNANSLFDVVVGDFGLAAKIPRSKTRLETGTDMFVMFSALLVVFHILIHLFYSTLNYLQLDLHIG